MAQKKPFGMIAAIFLIGLVLIGLGVSNTAGQIQQELDSLFNSVIPPDSLALAASSSTSLSCAYGQTVTASVSGAADNPYGLAYAVVTWYMDGAYVYQTSSSDSSSYTTASNLASGLHSLVAHDEYSGYEVVFSVSIQNPTLTISKSGSGSTSPSVGSYTSYAPGNLVTITAYPSTGYQFSHWARGTTYVFTATDNFPMPTSDFSTTAVFIPISATPTPIPSTPTPSPSPTPIPTYTLTIGISGQGTITPTVGTHTYNSGATASLSATAGAGYQFSYWLMNDGTKVYSSSTTLLMTSSKTALAVFTPIATPSPSPVPQYSLTVGISGSGSTSPSAGSYSYASGSSVPISATALSGSQFSYWLMNDGSKVYSSSTTLVMSSSKSALAVFTSTVTPTPSPVPQYSLTIAVSGSGSTTPGVGSHQYVAGSSVTISASASSGYKFSYWLLNSGTKVYSASTSLTMTSSKTALAVFVSTATPNPSVTATPEPTPLPTPIPSSSPTASPTSPTPIPTASPAPTVAPSNEPTPIPTAPSGDGEQEENTELYIDGNQLCTVSGGALLIIAALWLMKVQKWI